MPLFGHKNKNTNASATGTAHRSDPLASDYAAPSGGAGATTRGTDHTFDQNTVSEIGNPAAHTDASVNQDRYGDARTASGPGTGTGIGAGSGAGPNSQQQGIQGPTIHGHHAVGSAALREQAMLRDREAQNFKLQSQELVEAERLEQKAREHRERAVAQGAHPVNKHLGGQLPADMQNTESSHTKGGNY